MRMCKFKKWQHMDKICQWHYQKQNHEYLIKNENREPINNETIRQSGSLDDLDWKKMMRKRNSSTDQRLLQMTHEIRHFKLIRFRDAVGQMGQIAFNRWKTNVATIAALTRTRWHK